MKTPGLTYLVADGACTAVGLSGAFAAAAVRAGVSRFREHEFLFDNDGEPLVVARVPGLSGDPIGAERYEQMAVRAARQALGPLLARQSPTVDVPVFVGVPAERPGRPIDLERSLRAAFAREFGSQRVEFLPYGHAGGLLAFEHAADAIENGRAEICLAGGVDSYLDADTLEWLEAHDQLHSSDNPYGFVPGEAAGFVLLTSQTAAGRLAARPMARLWHVQRARETNLIRTDAVCLGKGLIAAMRGVLDSMSYKPARTYCDLNGETYRADEFGFAMQALGTRLEDTDAYVAPADCWGDVGAASGPLFASLFSASLARGYAKGAWVLLTTSAESGERCVAALTAAKS